MNPSPADDPTIVDTAATVPAGAYLEVTVECGGASQTTTVRSAVLTLGSDADCSVHIPAEGVSRRHARISAGAVEWVLEDMGSSNGTLVAGQRITAPVRLWPGQRFQLGTATVQVRRARGAATSAPGSSSALLFLPEEKRQSRRYDIACLVAQGGMGAVLDARDGAMERKVAMKVMLDPGDPEALARFIAEARITGQLEHPNIVPIHDIGVDENGHAFYTMKFVRGVTLAEVLAQLTARDAAAVEKYPLPVLLTVFQKVCDALAFAHSRGVIHRDLKPANIMLGDYGEVLVMDWGLAKLVDTAPAATPASPLHSSIIRPGLPEEGHSFGSTLTGSIMGTPQYMAPEQARGEIESLDARTDLYSLGAILFEVLHLRPPFSDGAAMEIVRRVSRGEVEWSAPKNSPAAPRREIPASLLAVCRKALALAPGDRYPRVAALQADLTAWQNGFATRAENAGAWTQIKLFVRRNKAASIGAAAVLLVGAVFGTMAVLEGRRATAALADLKKTAPALRQLAESEAGFQHFDSALEKLDAALALDAAHLPAYWRRAWLLIGMARLHEAAAALRLAQQKDPAHAELAAILPAVEELSALPSGVNWPTPNGRKVWDHLVNEGATGEAVVVGRNLLLGAKDKAKVVRQKLDEWLGKDKGSTGHSENGDVWVDLTASSIATVEPLRGLQIDRLTIGSNSTSQSISNLEPLRGMRLNALDITNTRVGDIEPLRGMPLHNLFLQNTKITDFSALRGMSLIEIYFGGLNGVDFSVLRGMKLRMIGFDATGASDLSFLVDAPLRYLQAQNNRISDLSPLAGKPLEYLKLNGNDVSDLTPLKGSPIRELIVYQNPLKDLTPLLDLPKLEKLSVPKLGKLFAPLRHHPTLKFIAYDDEPYRPVAELWADYDAQQAPMLDGSLEKVREALFKAGVTVSDSQLTTKLAVGIVLYLKELSVNDLSILRDLPIGRLDVSGSKVTDLAPLRGMKVKILNLQQTGITDFNPLLDMPALESVILPEQADIEILRLHRTLKFIGYQADWVSGSQRPKLTAEEFWKRHDAKK